MSDTPRIEIIDNSQYKVTLDPLYIVLGMLSEYHGRTFTEKDAVVESFFVDEYGLAKLFNKYAQLLCQKNNFQTKIVLTKTKTGHSYIESSELAQYLNNIFPIDSHDIDRSIWEEEEEKNHYTSGISQKMFPELNILKYSSAERDPRYSYLYGTYLREGVTTELAYRIANSNHKVELIKTLLEELECSWISHKYSLKGAPMVHYLTFGEDERLRNLLDSARQEKINA